jgi:hypothetical protein
MKNIKLSVLKKTDLEELAKFVVEENFSHHDEKTPDIQSIMDKEIKYIHDEELCFSNSKILVAKNYDDEIIGSIRTLRWNYRDKLPIERMFSINLKELIDINQYKVWHIGRFAIKKNPNETGIRLFKTLMACAINEVCMHSNVVAVAECDIKLLRTLKILGIEAFAITESIHYLGSETVPVILPYGGLKNFLDKHRHLLCSKSQQLHQGVVLVNHQQYYTFV